MKRSCRFYGAEYRPLLTRQLEQGNDRQCLFIMLNPSTATTIYDDPTIRKCMKFCRTWKFGWLHVVNLFDYRATAPKDMLAATDPCSEVNMEFIEQQARAADLIVCAWGKHGSHRGQAGAVRRLLAGLDLHYLALNKDGSPRHPLYVRDDTVPTLWRIAP